MLLAALALNVSAANPLASAFQRHHAGRANHALFPTLLPAEVYAIDDGSADISIGLSNGGDMISLNSFTVLPGAETITSVSIAWGSPSDPDPSLDGLPYLAVIWSDPDGDGDPADAHVLGTASGVISSQGTDTFVVTDLARTIPGSTFFVGLMVNQVVGQFPVGFDKANPLFNRSYVAGAELGHGHGDIYDLTNNNLPVLTIEYYGLFGNWTIRADATFSSPFRLLGAVSQMDQGEVGPQNIDLPLSGPAGIECRSGIPGERPGTYKWVFSFSEPVVSIDDAEVSCGHVQRREIDPAYPYQVILYTTNRQCSEQYVTATLLGVHSATETLPSAAATMGLLVGDVDADGVVTRNDTNQVKDLRGQTAFYVNFRADVTGNGVINQNDLSAVNVHNGDRLPPR